MTNRNLAKAVFRAWGLFWAISGCVQFASFALPLVSGFRPYAQDVQTQYEILQGCSVALTFLAAIFLFVKSDWLSSIVFREEAPLGWTIRGRELGAILFCAVGLEALLQGFRGGFAQIAYELFTMWKSESPSGAAWNRNPQQIASSIGGVIGGAVVFLMAARLNLLREVRGAYDETMGLKDSEPDDR